MHAKDIIWLSFAAGVGGAGLGGLYNFFIKEARVTSLAPVLGFAGGIMLTAVFSELIPEAVRISGLIHALMGVILGIFFLMLSDIIIDLIVPKSDDLRHHFTRTALMVFLAISSHNFPEGVAIGSGFAASYRMGFVLLLTLAIHNIPEGTAVATAFRLAGMKPIFAFAITLLTEVPMILGALLGHALGQVSPALISIALGFAAGAMIYTVCREILPDTYVIGKNSQWGLIWGFIAGIVFFNIL